MKRNILAQIFLYLKVIKNDMLKKIHISSNLKNKTKKKEEDIYLMQ